MLLDTYYHDRIKWAENHRPQTLKECVLRRTIEKCIQTMIKHRRVQNYLIFGPTGSGKTSFAGCLVNDLDLEAFWMSAPKITSVRNTLRTFTETHSMYQQQKVVILDEFDRTSKLVQAEVLKLMEDESVIFILIANDTSTFSEELSSRVADLDFNIPDSEKEDMQLQYLKRMKWILDSERISYSESELEPYIHKYFPSLRKIINEVQLNVSANNHLMPL